MKRRVLSLICTLAILLGMVTVPAFAADAVTGAAINGEETYSSLQAAVDDYFFGVIVLQEDAQDVTVSRDVYLDLNGHNVADVTVTGGTLYVSDSQTDDYTVADGSYGKVTGITGAVEAAEGYLAVSEEEAVSFHCVDLQIKAMSLRPGVAGVYYTSNFAGDEVVAEQVQSYGIALSIAGEPAEENLETTCGYSTITGFAAGENVNAANGTLLTGIMSDAYTAEENAENAAMPVYGRAYIKTAEGYVFGACVSRDLQTQVEAIDSIWGALTETQKAGVLDMYAAYESVISTWNVPNMIAECGNAIEDKVISIPVKAEDNVVTETVTVEQDGVTITIPFGALLEAGVEELTLTVTSKVADSGVVLEEGQVLLPLDVHVEGISADNTVPLTVALGKVLPENLNLGNYDLYHVEKTGTKQMELIANGEEFTAHNQFKYTLDGELTLHTATFSGFPVVFSAENTWNGERNYGWYDAEATELNIRNADQLAGFSAIVGGMDGQTQDSFSGKTVKLLADIRIGDLDSENGIVFYPVGYYNSEGTYEKSGTAITSGFKTFEGIFDGNGNTISEFYQNTWEMKGDHEWYAATEQHYRDGMGLFGKVYGGTVKNLTVDSFSSDGEITTTGVIAAYADCAAVFENIAIVNCNPRVYNIGNGGIVGCVGWYAKTDVEQPVSFRNITVDNSNKISALWGSWDVACGGLVGQYYPTSGQTEAIKNKGISFDNCHVAAQIDVYNDVCANYQYYAYRYAGMMIGSIRENVTVDGYVYPNMDGITAKNCTVEFDSWNDYYYCELVANSLASYTHDHQMSRLEQVKAVEGNTITPLEGEAFTVSETGRYNYVVVETDENGNFKHGDGNATCYHFVDGAVWNHEDADYEEVDTDGDGTKEKVLKEDKQCIYREFKQLFTGYGWGVTSKGLESFGEEDNIKVTHRDDGTSAPKFEVSAAETVYATDTTVTIGELFAAISGKEGAIQQGKVQVTVSPADPEDTTNTVAGTYEADAEDWTQGKLTFDGVGKAKITITDYFFCTPTVLEIDIAEICEHCDKPIADWQPLGLTKKATTYATSGHFYLEKSISSTASINNWITVTAEDFVLDLRGNSITNKAGRLIYVKNVNAKCSVLDTVGGAQLKGAYTAGGGIGYAIGQLNIYGGNWQNDGSSSIGGAVYVLRGSVNMYGGTLNGTHNVSKGGAIYVNGGHVTIYGGTILGGTASDNGDCIYMQKSTSTAAGILDGKLDIRGGTIEGQIYVKSDATLKISGEPVITDLDVIGTDLPTIGELTEGASIAITAENVGDTVSEELTVDNYEQYGKYFLATMDGCDVTVDGNVLKVAQSSCPHCNQADADIDWIELDSDNISSIIKLSENGTRRYFPSGHYRLTGNISCDSQLMVGNFIDTGLQTGEPSTMVLDLNGKTFRCKTTGSRTLYLTNKGTELFVLDNSTEGTGTIEGKFKTGGGGAIYVDQKTTLHIYGGTIEGTSTGDNGEVKTGAGGAFAAANATVNIHGGRIVGSAVSGQGGAISVTKGTKLNIYGGEIIGGSATYGGAIRVSGSTLNLNGGSVTAGTVNYYGDAIYGVDAATLNLNEGTVNGEFYATKTAKITIKGAPVLTELHLADELKVTIGELTAGADINVNATGAFTDTLTNADAVQSYIDNGYIKAHSSLDGKVLAIVDGVLTVTDAHVVEEPEETVPEETVPEETTEPTEETTEPTEETTEPTA